MSREKLPMRGSQRHGRALLLRQTKLSAPGPILDMIGGLHGMHVHRSAAAQLEIAPVNVREQTGNVPLAIPGRWRNRKSGRRQSRIFASAAAKTLPCAVHSPFLHAGGMRVALGVSILMVVPMMSGHHSGPRWAHDAPMQANRNRSVREVRNVRCAK